MSGGSFDYLCFEQYEADVIRKHALPEMLAELKAVAPNHPVTDYTERLVARADTTIPKSVLDVWKAIEWWRSSDWSLDQVRAALAETSSGPLDYIGRHAK